MPIPHSCPCPDGWYERLNSDERGWYIALHISTCAWRLETGVMGGRQLWGPFLSNICSCVSIWSWFLPLFSSQSFPFCPHLVNYGGSLILMGCTRLVMWFWVGCLKSTIALSSLSRCSPLNHISPAAKGKSHTCVAQPFAEYHKYCIIFCD